MYFFRIKYSIYICIIGFLLYSCDTSQEVTSDSIYFGGEIVNPNTDYIVLYKNNKYQDTIGINNRNRFLYKLKNSDEGLYSFRHNPENQLVLLEKGDSILIRLNTLEFDESLVFTGRGSRKNNFLIDIFLQNEIETKNLRKIKFRQDPTLFKKEQDSLFNLKLKKFDHLSNKYKLSDLSKKICRASFEYDYYSRHEMYLYEYQFSRSKSISNTSDFPEKFFDYRDNIDFNDVVLKRLYSYNRFLNQYLTNSSYTAYKNKKTFSKSNPTYAITKMNLVDSLIQQSYTKNNLLRGITTNFILDNKNDYTSQRVLNHYLSLSTDERIRAELKKLAKATARLKPNNTIPDQDLISSNGEITKLSILFKKPITALYFWTIERKDDYIRAHQKTKNLSSLYPEIDFIGINTDDEQTDNWLKTIKRHNYTLDNEYEFKFPKCSSNELVIHRRNKVILVDQQGKIIHPNANLFSPIFEKQLSGYSKRIELQKQKTAFTQ